MLLLSSEKEAKFTNSQEAAVETHQTQCQYLAPSAVHGPPQYGMVPVHHAPPGRWVPSLPHGQMCSPGPSWSSYRFHPCLPTQPKSQRVEIIQLAGYIYQIPNIWWLFLISMVGGTEKSTSKNWNRQNLVRHISNEGLKWGAFSPVASALWGRMNFYAEIKPLNTVLAHRDTDSDRVGASKC